MSILRDFYKGHLLYPCERPSPKDSTEHKELARKIGEAEQYFVNKMDENDREKWQSMKSMVADLDFLTECDLWVYSFSMGVVWAFDVVRETNDFMYGESDDKFMLHTFRELYTRLKPEEKCVVMKMLKDLDEDGST